MLTKATIFDYLEHKNEVDKISPYKKIELFCHHLHNEVILEFRRQIDFTIFEYVFQSFTNEVFLVDSHHKAEDVEPLIKVNRFGIA